MIVRFYPDRKSVSVVEVCDEALLTGDAVAGCRRYVVGRGEIDRYWYAAAGGRGHHHHATNAFPAKSMLQLQEVSSHP